MRDMETEDWMAAQVGHGQERHGERKLGWFLCGKLSNRDTAKSFGDVRRAIQVSRRQQGTRYGGGEALVGGHGGSASQWSLATALTTNSVV